MNTLEKVYGQLTVLETRKGVGGEGMMVVCLCSCGRKAIARAVALRSGRQLSCGQAHPCPKCGLLARGSAILSHAKACNGTPRKNQQQGMDLAEAQAFKKGGAVLLENDPGETDDMGDMIRFIRGQHDIAVPLLAKLYSLPEDDIRKIRRYALRSTIGRDRMPIKLLQELVDQRQERLSPEDFAQSSSSMALCENEA